MVTYTTSGNQWDQNKPSRLSRKSTAIKEKLTKLNDNETVKKMKQEREKAREKINAAKERVSESKTWKWLEKMKIYIWGDPVQMALDKGRDPQTVHSISQHRLVSPRSIDCRWTP